jgi:hypothetical protein
MASIGLAEAARLTGARHCIIALQRCLCALNAATWSAEERPCIPRVAVT